MTSQRAIIDASESPELRRVAEQVRKTLQPVVLRSGGEDIALVVPMAAEGERPSLVGEPTREQIDAVMAAAGSWAGLVEVDDLKASWRAARGSRRPPIEL